MQRHLPIALTATMLAFAGGSAFAQNDSGNNGANNGAAGPDTFSAMDTDNDGQIDKGEFTLYFDNSKIFKAWDVSDDGWIDEAEFADGIYDTYDDNEDGYISDAEWQDGLMVDDPGEEGFWDL